MLCHIDNQNIKTGASLKEFKGPIPCKVLTGILARGEGAPESKPSSPRGPTIVQNLDSGRETFRYLSFDVVSHDKTETFDRKTSSRMAKQ